MATIVQNCVKRYVANRGANPQRLIIYRNGTSEGQFGMSLQYEVPLIKHALEHCGAKETKLTVLVSQKAHNIRLFIDPMPTKTEDVMPNGRTRKINVNIRPGTVVDKQLTHPEHCEFYLNSHMAIQGTARCPRYSVLVDESEFTMDVIEGISYALSYGHQIINSPTSLPSPAYIALLYAKRGRNIYATIRDMRDVQPDPRHADGTLDFMELSNRYCYFTTTLRDQRVNA